MRKSSDNVGGGLKAVAKAEWNAKVRAMFQDNQAAIMFLVTAAVGVITIDRLNSLELVSLIDAGNGKKKFGPMPNERRPAYAVATLHAYEYAAEVAQNGLRLHYVAHNKQRKAA